jgi:hypothetical protein
MTSRVVPQVRATGNAGRSVRGTYELITNVQASFLHMINIK